jgi:HEAT repeat protein
MNTNLIKKILVSFFFCLLPQYFVLAEDIKDANDDKIVEQLLSKEEKIRQQGRLVLLALTTPNDVSGMEKYLTYKDNWTVRYEAVSALTSVPGRVSTKRLLEAVFQDTNPAVISAASHSLKGRGKDITKDEILKLLDMDNATVTRETLGVIQEITIDEAILKSLVIKLEDTRWYIRTDTARALSKAKGIAGATKVNLILNAMKETCENPPSEGRAKGEGMCIPLAEHMKSLYRSAILNMGDSAIEPLKERMGKEKNEFGKNLIVTLGLLGERSVYPDLINIATNDENMWLRASAIGGLGAIGNKKAIPFLKEALNDSFKVAVKTDVITPDMYKDVDGFYYYDYYPVRSESFSALSKLGVKVKKEGNEYKIIE